MDRFCRGCLVKFDEPSDLLQYTEKNRRLFVYSTGLQVKRNDTFTFQLCKDCYLNMKVACSFKKQCRSSDKKLKSYSALKDSGDTMDLSAYLKNSDDSWTYKFPMLYGSSTPSHQKPRDDDCESSSSIRNFMTDIMPETDLLETEARIIKEVIQEDADLLDESLDSHWLQDDVSIDTNFRLDFSFSPFSTPRSENNAAYTPKELPKSKSPVTQKEQEFHSILPNKVLDMPTLDASPIRALVSIKEEKNCIYEETDNSLMPHDILKQGVAVDNAVKLDLNDIETVPDPECIIDKNLEEALKNSDNNEFLLDELLVSPQVIPGIQTPPTPLINNILFGETLDMGDSNNSHRYVPGRLIETFENVIGDIEMTETSVKIDGFDLDKVKCEIVENNNQHKELEYAPIKMEVIENYKQTNEEYTDMNDEIKNNFYCKMCSKTFSTLKQMQRHALLHTRVFTCDFCGKHSNDKANFTRHVRTHMREKPTKLECDECKSFFTSKLALQNHKMAHSGQEQVKSTRTKRFMCSQCTFSSDKSSNFKIHLKRHEKAFTFTCPECGKGYHRRTELVIHMRYHTGERPFRCGFCDRGYPRRDALTRHVKTHLEKPFECGFCKIRFVNNNHLKNHIKKSKNCMKIRDQIAKDQKKIDEENADFIVTETLIDCLKSC